MRLEASIAAYLRQLVILGRAQTTIRATDYALRALVRFLEGLGIVAVDGLNREAILLYQEELAFLQREFSVEVTRRLTWNAFRQPKPFGVFSVDPKLGAFDLHGITSNRCNLLHDPVTFSGADA